MHPSDGLVDAVLRGGRGMPVADHALEALLDAEAVRRVRAILADRPDAIVTIGDPEGRLLWASAPGSEGMFGRNPETFQGHTRFDYVHPDDRDRARAQYARALMGDTVRYVVRARTAEGAYTSVASVAWCVEGPWGTAVLTITTPSEDDLG